MGFQFDKMYPNSIMSNVMEHYNKAYITNMLYNLQIHSKLCNDYRITINIENDTCVIDFTHGMYSYVIKDIHNMLYKWNNEWYKYFSKIKILTRGIEDNSYYKSDINGLFKRLFTKSNNTINLLDNPSPEKFNKISATIISVFNVKYFLSFITFLTAIYTAYDSSTPEIWFKFNMGLTRVNSQIRLHTANFNEFISIVYNYKNIFSNILMPQLVNGTIVKIGKITKEALKTDISVFDIAEYLNKLQKANVL